VLVVTGALVVAFTRARQATPAQATEVAGELLTYEVRPGAPLRLKVPGGLDRVVLTTWALQPPGAPVDPLVRLRYGLDVAFWGAEGGRAFERAYATESRVSTPQDAAVAALESEGWLARLADADDPIADPRTTTVRLDGAGAGGELRVSLAPWSAVRSVLVRASYPQDRNALARGAIEERLDATARQRMVEGRASLGFEDLPAEARSRALSVWGRRLDAVGRDDIDFRTRRLLLSDVRRPPPSLAARALGWDVGGGHAAAFNVKGPFALRINAPPNVTLRLTEGAGPKPPRREEVSSGPAGVYEARFGGEVARTVTVEALAPGTVRARFFAAERDVRARIASTPAAPPDPAGAVELGPETFAAKAYRLAPDAPLVVRVAPGQDTLGVALRAGWRPDAPAPRGPASPPLALRARWTAPGAASPTEATLAVPPLPFSPFDRGRDGTDLSESWSAAVRLPPGVETVELFGDPALCVTPWTFDPEVSVSELRPPYRVPLAPEEVWRHAPYEARALVSLRLANSDDLERSGRAVDVVAQPRIVLPERPVLAERSLLPAGDRGLGSLLEPVAYGPGMTPPDGLWARLPGGGGIVSVEKAGPRAGRLDVVYGVGPDRLGELVRLVVDGREAARQLAVTRTGELRAEVPPGERSVLVDGLGGGGFAFADAPAARGGEVLARRSAAPLRPGGALTYRFTQRAGEALHLVLFVAAQNPSRRWSLGYEIEAGRNRPLVGRFFEHVTALRGRFDGPAEPTTRAWVWDGASSGPGAIGGPPGAASVVKVHLGEDLDPGRREVTVRSLGRDQLWVRAVLAGQAAAPADSVRFFTESLDLP
jgi:hypothetical protein